MPQHLDAPPAWNWPQSDVPVDLAPYVLQEWTAHKGDSRITLARPRKRRGAPTPPPAYLLKAGRDAIGERTYYLLARSLNLPTAVVHWADYSDLPVAAIRFEPDAWRPDRVDADEGVVRSGERMEQLVNPMDDYRHGAVYYALDEGDDTEFMVRDHILFRIDAASVGDALWSTMVGTLAASLSDMPLTSQEQSWESLRWMAERLRADTAKGYSAYMETLAELACHPEWDEAVAHDLRTCPGQEWRINMRAVPGYEDMPPSSRAQLEAWADAPLTDRLADAYLLLMERQRATIQRMLAESAD